ncbi:hypothetical protein COY23_03940 [bacterium (Candidatus Torokbacteria) CG_4_10_14_0_2_um_filter_35_8]|nr:MAG: hypothetical protein COY23_03940 [bacterium (Candidatus Torokbacteria) CG_4_10_14_0_2_um_filter_35_8]
MDYIKIIKKSADITWNNKFLWILGLLAGGGLSSFNSGGWNFFQGNGEDLEKAVDSSKDFLSENFTLILVALVVILLITIILGILSIIFKGGLISCTNKLSLRKSEQEKLNLGEQIRFSYGFREGLKYFWKVLGLGLIIFLILLPPIILLVAVGVFAVLKNLIIGMLIIGLIVLFLIPIAIIVSLIYAFGLRFLIIKGLGIRQSLKKGKELLFANFWKTIIAGVVLLIINMFLVFAMFVGIAIIAVPFVILGFILVVLLQTIGIIISIVFGGIAFLILFAVLQGIINAFHETYWTLVFKELTL